MSQAPPPPPPPPSSGAASVSASSANQMNAAHHPPAPIVYALPPKGPGILRTVVGAVVRFVAVLVILFLIFGFLAGLLQFAFQHSEGPRVAVYRPGDATQEVAILDLSGAIDEGAAEFVRSCVDFILNNDSIKAVVFRVNSPGGGVTASDHIWYQIKRLRDKGYHVTASYGSVAASGGVYASCHSDYIFAEPTTVTGSIGVIAQVLTYGGLMEKIGVDPVTLVASQSPDKDVANDPFREWTDKDREKIRKILDASYDTFFSRVWEGRKHVYADEDELRVIADGSIFTAEEAVSNKLVDAVGYLDDAIDYAISKSALPRGARVVRLEPWPTGFDLPFGLSWQRGGHNTVSAGGAEAASIPIDPEEARLWLHEFTRSRAMYLMPGS